MTFSFEGHGIAISDEGSFTVFDRSTEQVEVTIDLTGKHAVIACTSSEFIVGEDTDSDMTVVDSTDLEGNQVELTTGGEICKSQSACRDIRNKAGFFRVVDDQLQLCKPLW